LDERLRLLREEQIKKAKNAKKEKNNKITHGDQRIAKTLNENQLAHTSRGQRKRTMRCEKKRDVKREPRGKYYVGTPPKGRKERPDMFH